MLCPSYPLAMVSIWEKAGAVVIYDSKTLQEKERFPFTMPIGKYNALLKTRLTF